MINMVVKKRQEDWAETMNNLFQELGMPREKVFFVSADKDVGLRHTPKIIE
jgi:hypothetical protein